MDQLSLGLIYCLNGRPNQPDSNRSSPFFLPLLVFLFFYYLFLLFFLLSVSDHHHLTSYPITNCQKEYCKIMVNLIFLGGEVFYFISLNGVFDIVSPHVLKFLLFRENCMEFCN